VTAARIRTAAALLALVASLGFLVPKLVSLADETAEFRRLSMSDSGRVPPPFPERLVRAARAELKDGESWSLITPAGRCIRDEPMYWLAFRLMPNTADCDDPDVTIYWRVVDTEPGQVVVNVPGAFALVRP
jgi:hypothetical protein